MREQIALVLHGGPADGDSRMTNVDTWPPPERVAFKDTPGGHYLRTRHSQLPEALPNIIRGADYEWVPDAP